MDDKLVFRRFKIGGGLYGKLVYTGLFDAIGGLPCLVTNHCGRLEGGLDVFGLAIMRYGGGCGGSHIHALHFHGVDEGYFQLHIGVLLVHNCGRRRNNRTKMGLGLSSQQEQQGKAGAASFPHRKFPVC